MTPKTPLKPAANATDAIALLVADHKAVKALFKEYQALAGKGHVPGQKAALVARICDELTVHAQVEEEIFYPAVRDAIDDDAALDQATVEHTSARDLIAQLRAMRPGEDLYDAKVKVLSAYVDHHVIEEETEIFPEARRTGMATQSLGSQMAARKEELKAQAEVPGADGYGPPRAKAGNGTRPATKVAR